MRASISSTLVLTGAVAGLASIYGCSAEDATPQTPIIMGQAGTSTAPIAGTGQGTSGASQGTGGSAPVTGGSGPQGGSAPVAGTSAGGSSTGGSGTAGTTSGGSGAGGDAPVGGDITKVAPSAACGTAFTGMTGATNKNTIPTMGTKDANCAAHLAGQAKCGAWTTPRDYYVFLPAGYDMSKPYTLVFMGPGCGGSGKDIYGYNNNADNTIIRVGLTPPPNSLGHGTNENQGCFDDKEGDDSTDWVFYENLYDKLNSAGGLCFDKNRVFAGGNSSGAWFSNELGCKYAGDATRPVRGIMPNTGGLPVESQYKPTCTTKPMAGMWIHETGDTTNPFDGNIRAIERVLPLNGCSVTTYTAAVAKFQDFNIGGGNACKRISECNPLYPLVVCPLNGNGHGSHDDVVNPGVSTFLKMFSAPPLLTQ